MELSIEDLRKICTIENLEITLHAAKRLEQRDIKTSDIIIKSLFACSYWK